ncbi:UDP-N-acetylglucosamine--LPS N-acetylglucosamine transferase [Benzoatithermus flavus]|uniref:Oligosaccharide biosynthesis protein Alg14 like n=1 Tax=Benzoatithermus flavus TaxID=3108223 RepID=A0ABU8XQC8_9PROT
MSELLWIETRRTCWAYSPGGHLAELERATAGIRFSDRFDVTFAGGRPPREPPRRIYHVCHPRRSAWRTLLNLLQALRIVLRERPRLVISTGADVAVPVCILARLAGARLVFVETTGELEPSLSGRLLYPFADLFIVPWPEKLRAFPRAILARGPLL